MCNNFHIVVDHSDLNKSHGYGIRPKVLYRKHVNTKYDVIVVSQLGEWLHNKVDDECIRTFSSTYRRDKVVFKLLQFGVPVKRLPWNPRP